MSIEGECAALLRDVNEAEDNCILDILYATANVTRALLVRERLKSLAAKTNRYWGNRKKPITYANAPADAPRFEELALQFFGGTPGDEAYLQTIAKAVMETGAYCAWLSEKFKLEPVWKKGTRERQLNNFRALAKKYFWKGDPRYFTGMANDPKKWKYHLHEVVRFNDPGFVDSFANCLRKYLGGKEKSGDVDDFCAQVRKILAKEEAAEAAREAAEEVPSQIAPTGEANAAVVPAVSDAAQRAIAQSAEAAEQNPPVAADQEAAAQQHVAPEDAAPLMDGGAAAVAPAGTEAPASDGTVTIATTQRRPARTSNFAAPSH